MNNITTYDFAYLEIELMAHQALRKIEDRWNRDTAEMFPLQIDKRTGTINIRDKEGVVRVKVGVL